MCWPLNVSPLSDVSRSSIESTASLSGIDPGPPLRHVHHLRSHPLHRGIKERLLGYGGRIALIEVLDLQPYSTTSVCSGGTPRYATALPERVPEFRARYVPDHLASTNTGSYPITTTLGSSSTVQTSLPGAVRPLLVSPAPRLDETSFVRLHREAEAGLIRVVLGRHVRAPEAR